MILYYVDGGMTKRSDATTKKHVVGPFVAQVVGHYWREEPASEEEVEEYVRRMHGVGLLRTERVSRRDSTERENNQDTVDEVRGKVCQI